MKVTIITIVYNNCDFISECIQSVLNQSYKDIEYIVIDGNSTDGTQKKIELFRDKLAFYVSESDQGLYDALNKGISHATGDIIGILHSDDLFYGNDTIQKVVKAFQKSNAGLVYANGQYVEKDNIDSVKRMYSAKPFRKYYLPFGWIPLHTTIYVRREVFRDYGSYNQNYSISSDYDISLRWFMEKRIKKYFLDEWVVKMRLGGKSTTSSLQRRKSKEDLQIIKEHQLLGLFTLFCKIGRKIPQYLKPIYLRATCKS